MRISRANVGAVRLLYVANLYLITNETNFVGNGIYDIPLLFSDILQLFRNVVNAVPYGVYNKNFARIANFSI